MSEPVTLYFDRDGALGIGATVPVTCVPLCVGDEGELERLMGEHAHYLDDRETPMIPGLLWAEGRDAALEAIAQFRILMLAELAS